MLKSGVILSVISLLIAVLSFVNQIVIASYFGSSQQMTSYLLAYSLPAVFIGILNMLFSFNMVALLGTYKEKARSPETYSQLLGAFTLVFAGAAVAIMTMGALISDVLIENMGQFLSADVRTNAVTMMKIFWMTAAISVPVSFFAAVSNVQRRFVMPLCATALPYAGMLAMTLLFASRWGSVATAMGMLLGTFFTGVLLVIPLLKDLSFGFPWSGETRHPVTRFLAQVPLVLLAMLCFCATSAIDAYWAPAVHPDLLAHLGYAQRLLLVIITLLAFGPSAVLTPRLVQLHVSSAMPEFRADAAQALRLIVAVSVPACVVFTIFRLPIVQLLFERGAFDRASTVGVSSLLPWLLLATIPMAASVVLMKALFAMQRPGAAAVIGACQAAGYFALAGVASRFHSGTGMAMAFALSWWVAGSALVLVIWRGSRRELYAEANRQLVARLALSTIVLAVLAWLAKQTFFPLESLEPALALSASKVIFVLLLLGVTFWVFAVHVFKVPELLMLKKMMERRSAPRSNG